MSGTCEERRWTRRPSPALRAALLLLLLLLPAAGCQKRTNPSIVVILIDTLRADYLGAYGFPAPTSPNIDALARESVVFEHAYSQAPWTKPSVASLFTSLQPSQHRVLSHEGKFAGADNAEDQGRKRYSDVLPQQALTLAEVLRNAGYETAAFVANPWVQRRLGFAQGFDLFDGRGSGKRIKADEVFARVRDWLGRRNPTRPFLLYVHLMDVHGPYDAAQTDFDALSASEEAFGRSRRLTPEELAGLRRYLLTPDWTREPFSDRPEVWRGHYAAGVRAVDRSIGGFLAELKSKGLLDPSVVVLTSDHGEELLDHGGWDHGHRLFDHQTRVPLILHLPDGRSAGTRVDAVVSLIDVMPTLVELAGVAAPAGIQGQSLLPLLADTPPSRADQAAYSSAVKWDPEARSIRLGKYKLIVRGGEAAPQLYDLEADPREQRDLAASEPAMVAELQGRLAAHRASMASSSPLPRASAAIPAKLRRRLEALGYASGGAPGQADGEASAGAAAEPEPGVSPSPPR